MRPATAPLQTPHSRMVPYLMLLIAFLAQSAAIGLTYGSFGLLVEPVSQALGSGRAVGSLPIGVIAVISGFISPTIGRWMDQWSLRNIMATGCLIGAGGFIVAARADSVTLFILGYGVLAGVAFAMMGTLAANKIANAWFPHRLGWANGIANLPLANAIVPPLFALVLVTDGWRTLLDLFAGIFVVMLFITLFVRKPAAASTVPDTAVPDTASGPTPAAAEAALRSPWRVPLFWVILIASGVLQTSGIVAITHLVPYAQGHGVTETHASLLLSVFGVCSVVGALFFGWLSDRITPARALMINAVLQVVLWLGIIALPVYPVMMLPVGALAVCTGGEFPVAAALLGQVFSQRQFGSALGQLMLLSVPFNFIAAPLAGYLFDQTGGYSVAFGVESLLCVTAVALLWVTRKHFRAAPAEIQIG